MLGQSVIDVDVGGNQMLKYGFYIVILKRQNSQCTDMRYDRRIDSTVDLEKENDNNTVRMKAEKSDIFLNVTVTEIDYDVGQMSWIIVIQSNL